MRVFITGCAGFLGSHLADAFLTRGDHVSGVDSLIGGYEDNVPQHVDWYKGDCNNRDRLVREMRGVDLVYHCAATAHEGLSVFAPHENAMNGYAASAAVISAACQARVPRMVFCTSMARYGSGERPPPFTEDMKPAPEDPYGIGKYAAELLLANMAETHGLQYTIAVPHNIYGPRQKYDDPYRNVVSIFANMMLRGRQPIIYGDGSQTRCFSYVSDDVAPLVRMADEDAIGETFNIGPDEEIVSVLDVAKIVADVIGFKLDPIFVNSRPREVKHAHCSADKARVMLGYDPKVPLRDGIEKTVEWISKRGTRAFQYTVLTIEIENEKLPKTWAKRMF